MNIHFNRTPGIIHDIYDSIYFIYNDNLSSFLQEYNMEANKEVAKGLKYLSKKIDTNKPFMKVFFHEASPIRLLLEDKSILWSFTKPLDYVNYLKSIDSTNIDSVIINSMENLKKNQDAALEILKSQSKTIDFIKEMDVEDDLKWSLLNFLNQPLKYISEYISFLEDYIPHVIHVLEKSSITLEEFDRRIEENIKKEGTDFVKNTLSYFYNLFEYEATEDIYITSLFFNYISCVYYQSKNYLCFFIGLDFEKAVKQISGETELDRTINTFKNLSDKTRFRILQLLKTQKHFGQEIADKIGISMATVSYHMNYLVASGLVTIEVKGRKTFYNLNKEGFIKSMDFLKKEFNL